MNHDDKRKQLLANHFGDWKAFLISVGKTKSRSLNQLEYYLRMKQEVDAGWRRFSEKYHSDMRYDHAFLPLMSLAAVVAAGAWFLGDGIQEIPGIAPFFIVIAILLGSNFLHIGVRRYFFLRVKRGYEHMIDRYENMTKEDRLFALPTAGMRAGKITYG